MVNPSQKRLPPVGIEFSLELLVKRCTRLGFRKFFGPKKEMQWIKLCLTLSFFVVIVVAGQTRLFEAIFSMCLFQVLTKLSENICEYLVALKLCVKNPND